jgi:hypothetical protein
MAKTYSKVRMTITASRGRPRPAVSIDTSKQGEGARAQSIHANAIAPVAEESKEDGPVILKGPIEHETDQPEFEAKADFEMDGSRKKDDGKGGQDLSSYARQFRKQHRKKD